MIEIGNSFIIPKIWLFLLVWKQQNCLKYSSGVQEMWFVKKKLDKIKEELADVVNYCILMADTCGLDLDEIVRDKVKKTMRNIQ